MTLPREELDAWGFTWLPDLELPAQISDTGGELPVRDVLRSASSPALRELASAPQMLAGASSLLGGRAFPVRAHLFVKSPSRSWGVPWHQDRVVAVERRVDALGFEGWSRKAGVDHALAPDDVLRRMVALRLHLLSCPSPSGGLEVIAGTHHRSLDRVERERAVEGAPVVDLSGHTGAVLAMRPLLLHRSLRPSAGRRRVVLHVEYACGSLPRPLEWKYRQGLQESPGW
ncbi:MAG: phytanoyl-CoA dioxygenase family protein [Myxococcota bacterium]